MQPNTPPEGAPSTVVVKFYEGTQIPHEEQAESKAETKSVRKSWKALNKRFPKATLKPLYPYDNHEALRANTLSAEVANADQLPVEDATLFFTVETDVNHDTKSLVKSLRRLKDVDYAYVMSGPIPPPDFNPGDDPLARFQGYVAPSPIGISAAFAQNFPGGDGAGVQFIDIEQGWILDHEDLVQAQVRLLGGISRDYHGHGTAVLGEIVAVDNDRGLIGIARNCQAGVISQFNPAGQYRTDQAILQAVQLLRPGDVILLEAQVTVPGSPNNPFPVEIEPLTLNAIRIAFNKGITVIEAGGNGSNDLDSFRNAGGQAVLNRSSPNFAESGAIVVGAASSSDPHQRLGFSNFGSRIDCYAWGENIVTTGDGFKGTSRTEYTNRFGGTSGASPIIAGAAILLQAIRRAITGTPFRPREVRALLSDPQLGILSANPNQDRIGVMPNLQALLNSLFTNHA